MPSQPPVARIGEILVVEDEARLRSAIAEHLRRRRFRVAMASDGRAAILAIQRNPSAYGLMLVDLHLPGADGLTVMRMARQAGAIGLMVVVTGYASLDSAVEAVRLGAYDYLVKPFSLGQLDVIVDRANERLAIEHQNRLLSEWVQSAETTGALSAVHTRLVSLDERLDRLERLVSEVLTSGRPD
jgi:DNA-binding NtrC family response regulator